MSVYNATATGRFERGWQPCANYSPHDDMLPGAGNEHECYCRKNGSSCEGAVSSCRTCGTDHHSGGYESCDGCGETWAAKEKPHA